VEVMSLEQFKFGKEDENSELFPAFVAAYASEERFHPFINETYEKKKDNYYRAALEHPHYDHFYFSVGSHKKQLIAKKLLGIMAYSYDHEQKVFQRVIEELRKRYAKAFEVVQKREENNYKTWMEYRHLIFEQYASHRTENVLSHYTDYFRKDGRFIPNVTDYQFRPMVYYLFYSIYLGKPSDFYPFGEKMKVSNVFLGYKKIQQMNAREESPLSQIKQEKRKKLVHQLKKNILNPITKELMEETFHYDDEKEEWELYGTLLTVQDIAFLYSHISLRHSVYMPMLIDELSKKELEAKVEEFSAICPYTEDGSLDESVAYVYTCLLLDQLFRTLKKERSASFEQLYATDHHTSSILEEDMEKLRKENEHLQAELEKTKEEQIQKQTLFQKQKKDLEKENMELKRQLTLLTKKESKWKAKEENYINEVAVLREFEHQFSEQEEHEQATMVAYTEEDIDYIKEKNIVIAGGSKMWRQQLQELFGKSVTFIESNQHNFDLNIIRNSSFVYLNMTHISHGFSYKIVNECKARKIPFRFTNRKFVPYSIQEMVDYLKKLD